MKPQECEDQEEDERRQRHTKEQIERVILIVLATLGLALTLTGILILAVGLSLNTRGGRIATYNNAVRSFDASGQEELIRNWTGAVIQSSLLNPSEGGGTTTGTSRSSSSHSNSLSFFASTLSATMAAANSNITNTTGHDEFFHPLDAARVVHGNTDTVDSGDMSSTSSVATLTNFSSQAWNNGSITFDMNVGFSSSSSAAEGNAGETTSRNGVVFSRVFNWVQRRESDIFCTQASCSKCSSSLRNCRDDAKFLTTCQQTFPYSQATKFIRTHMDCSEDEGTRCGYCSYIVYAYRMCVVVDIDATTGLATPSATKASCNYPFTVDADYQAEVVDAALQVQLRSSNDPYVVLQELTQGTADFGETTTTVIGTGGVCLLVGVALCVGCAVHKYRQLQQKSAAASDEGVGTPATVETAEEPSRPCRVDDQNGDVVITSTTPQRDQKQQNAENAEEQLRAASPASAHSVAAEEEFDKTLPPKTLPTTTTCSSTPPLYNVDPESEAARFRIQIGAGVMLLGSCALLASFWAFYQFPLLQVIVGLPTSVYLLIQVHSVEAVHENDICCMPRNAFYWLRIFCIVNIVLAIITALVAIIFIAFILRDANEQNSLLKQTVAFAVVSLVGSMLTVLGSIVCLSPCAVLHQKVFLTAGGVRNTQILSGGEGGLNQHTTFPVSTTFTNNKQNQPSFTLGETRHHQQQQHPDTKVHYLQRPEGQAPHPRVAINPGSGQPARAERYTQHAMHVPYDDDA